MAYAQSQISAVRKLQDLHGVEGTLSDEACKEYLDWHLGSQNFDSVGQAIGEGLANGEERFDEEVRRLADLAE